MDSSQCPERTIGICGRFCSDCQFYCKECKGCIEENKAMSEKCIILECAQKRGVRNCLNCPVTMLKCSLLQGLSKSYCPIVALREMKKESRE